MNLPNTFLSYFAPSMNRILLTILAISVYRNTYSHIDINWIRGGLIPALLFPSFYISYMYIYYPGNFNYLNINPIIPEGGLITELNTLIHSAYKTILIFITLYLSLNVILYKDRLIKYIPRFK